MVLRRIAATINRPCLIETQKSPLAALAYIFGWPTGLAAYSAGS